MRNKYLYLALLPLVVLSAGVVWWMSPGSHRSAHAAQGDREAMKKLPLTQVVLFNSGVGYFQREGTVEGNSRIDMTFPATDVNDLLKSLLLEDLNGGKISTISYDSQQPVEHTLRGFMLDLTANPTFGDLLNQARGEKVEVTLQGNAQANTLTGCIIGLEAQARGTDKETHQLNLKCAEGVRCVPLSQVQRLRFLNPTLDAEFQLALDVLAGSHDSMKKTVSLNFLGEGKRAVRVGYVVENPIWKASYRLKIDKEGKVGLQSWAVVENTTDEDWKDVRMSLVAGRPISFQMDLYQPLFVPRPTVEPDLFASLRPPLFQGALVSAGNMEMPPQPGGGFQQGFQGFQQGGMQLGGFQQGGMQLGGFQPSGQPNFSQFGQSGMNIGATPLYNALGNGFNFGRVPVQPVPRLTYDELMQRKEEKQKAREEAMKKGSALTAINSHEAAPIVEGRESEESYQYVIDQKVTVPRQKSAMLPLMNEDVKGMRLSIFNEKVQGKNPMLGLRFKNTTGQPLMQGPVMIFEGGRYAGDARIMDMQAGEERFLAYAVDLGMEVSVGRKETPQQVVAAKIVKGVLHANQRPRLTTTYKIMNRSRQERVLIVEHPFQSDRKLVSQEKPIETTRSAYRFEVKVPTGKLVELDVVEDRMGSNSWNTFPLDERTFAAFHTNETTDPKIKEAMRKANEMRLTLEKMEKAFNTLDEYGKYVANDRAVLRTNLERVEKGSELYKRYEDKLLPIESEYEKLQTRVDEEKQKLRKQQREYENYLLGLNIE